MSFASAALMRADDCRMLMMYVMMLLGGQLMNLDDGCRMQAAAELGLVAHGK